MRLKSPLLVALAVAFAVVPAARAQTLAPPSPWESPKTAPMTEAQAWTLAEALNKGEVDAAKVAVARAKTPAVKGFAQHMLQSHGDAARAEREMARRLNLRTQGSPQLDQLKAKNRAVLQKLNATPRAEFDRVYVDAAMEAHQQALDLLDRDLVPSATNPEVTASLETLRDEIAEHLDQARAVHLELD